MCATCPRRWRRELIPSLCVSLQLFWHLNKTQPGFVSSSHTHLLGLGNLCCSSLCCLQFGSVWSEMWGPGGNGNGSSQQHSMTLPRLHLEGCTPLCAPNYQPGTDKWAACLGRSSKRDGKRQLDLWQEIKRTEQRELSKR